MFGGVWEGAILSALAATVGSSVAFGMAKVDSPVRKKALEVVEEYPSLRGIEKVRYSPVIFRLMSLLIASFGLLIVQLSLSFRLLPKMV